MSLTNPPTMWDQRLFACELPGDCHAASAGLTPARSGPAWLRQGCRRSRLVAHTAVGHALDRQRARLKHVPQNLGTGFTKKDMPNRAIERDDDSKKSNPDLARARDAQVVYWENAAVAARAR